MRELPNIRRVYSLIDSLCAGEERGAVMMMMVMVMRMMEREVMRWRRRLRDGEDTTGGERDVETREG